MHDTSQSNILLKIYGGNDFLDFLDAHDSCKKDVFSLWNNASEKLRSGDENIYFVLFSDSELSKIIGLAKIIQSTTEGNTNGMVHNVIVIEEFRGLGLGERLLSAVLDYGREQKYQYLELTSKPFRVAANNLYKKIGFTLISEAKDQDDTNCYRFLYS